MDNKKFESTLAYFCSPVLMASKVSNLVSISKQEIPSVIGLVQSYNKDFAKYDINILPVCECGNRVLLFVYRQSLLGEYLREENVSSMLEEYGYHKHKSLNYYVSILSMRMKKENFPHEIGLFLGYPVEDVRGFVEKQGRDYKYNGYWKVYGDCNLAIRRFNTYDKLRNYMLGKLSGGESLDSILSQNKNKLFTA